MRKIKFGDYSQMKTIIDIGNIYENKDLIENET